MEKTTKQWVSEKFGIPENDVLSYHAGNCYDTAHILTEESANKIKEKMNGRYVNGGAFDGMKLGRIEKCNTFYVVTC